MASSASIHNLANINDDAPLLSDDGSTVWSTASDVRDRTLHWARQFAAQRSLVFLYIRNTVESVTQFFGALDAGHVVALLDPKLPAASKAELAQLYRPRFICDGPGILDQGVGETKDLHPDLAVLLSTSGSTGSPKFVRLSSASLADNAAAIAKAVDIQVPEVGCGHLPLHYSYGLSVLTSHLARGAPVHLTERGFLDPSFWLRMREWKIAHLPGVPFHYQTLRRLRFERMELPNLRVMTQAGGALDSRIRALAHEFMDGIAGRFHVMYGQTEAAPRITTLSHEDFPAHPEAVGNALDGGRLEVLAESGEPVPAGTAGDVVYFGSNVMMGYAESPEDLALGDICHGRLITGDIGWLDEGGRLTITGRTKRVGKIAGLRVNLDEIERLLVAHFGEVAVTQVTENLKIFYLSSNQNSNLREQALPILAARFTLPQVAYQFKEIDVFPRTSRNKIDYGKLV